jgi:hypothetical protein
MKSNLFALTIFLLVTIFCHGQTYSSMINDSEIYSFINTAIKTDKDRIHKKSLKKILLWPNIDKWDKAVLTPVKTSEDVQKLDTEKDYFFLYKKVDSLFTEEDRIFMLKQINSFKDTVWRRPFKGSTFVSKANAQQYSFSFSIPIFSIDRSIAAIYFSGSGRQLCGFGGYYFYKRTDKGLWKFVTAVGHWIS